MKLKIYMATIVVLLIIAIILYNKKEKYITKTVLISDTILNIKAQTTERNMEKLINAITNEINRIDFIINPYNKESEISILNKKSLEGETQIKVSKELASIISTGLKYSKLADGYDISIRPLIELWGFGVKTNQTVPSKEEIDNALLNINYTKAMLYTNDNDDIYINLSSPLAFDFGASGKGYIIDKIKNIFNKFDIKNYLIDYGGDTYANGVNQKGNPWVIAIRNPRNDEDGFLGLIQSTNTTIVTSGDYERFFIENNTNYHHIINSITGYPSTNAISATIVHTNAEDADSLSTIAFLLGTNFFNNTNFIYKEAYIVDENGELFIQTNYSF